MGSDSVDLGSNPGSPANALRSLTILVAPNACPSAMRALMGAHEDDLLGPEAFGCDDPTEPNSAVADDRRAFAGFDARHDRCMMSGAHDIRERKEDGISTWSSLTGSA
jgi:hypothetical protein